MAYNERIAERIRIRFRNLPDVEEKRMMGGLTFMVNGKMCVGVLKDEMMCRIAPEEHNQAIERNGCRTMDFTKRPMRGYVMVEEGGMGTEKDFDYWINLSLAFNAVAKSSKKR